ncbi:hypothetical protein SARC_01750 [Sphaeroforma arctica JP610]|uniref:peptidylprolyl isomerase n=1 Tax=Sphaeroforma arctica JP610 TaxID=667725 RepID=A0A0L0GB34_9EUKA|nr:hypothetical protein SARC_01750 [Sphaeroforma arctica JP610]KNC86091.1 hypothetical protein SARC_01750 [Sphaeroforma arctica JP610]|eukprot:XP_014159993.1 hypothetical protein SARC_01750 [Sphaeroforma arctica JP610]
MVRFLVQVPALCLVLSAVCANANPLKDLGIGVKKRVPEEECLYKARGGDTVHVHYTGKLLDTGEQFDSSRDKDKPFSFRVGRGHVIAGWDKGVLGMCIGEDRKLKVPAALGYGERGSPSKIPGNSDLVFEITLLEIERLGDKLSQKSVPQEEEMVSEEEEPLSESEEGADDGQVKDEL